MTQLHYQTHVDRNSHLCNLLLAVFYFEILCSLPAIWTHCKQHFFLHVVALVYVHCHFVHFKTVLSYKWYSVSFEVIAIVTCYFLNYGFILMELYLSDYSYQVYYERIISSNYKVYIRDIVVFQEKIDRLQDKIDVSEEVMEYGVPVRSPSPSVCTLCSGVSTKKVNVSSVFVQTIPLPTIIPDTTGPVDTCSSFSDDNDEVDNELVTLLSDLHIDDVVSSPVAEVSECLSAPAIIPNPDGNERSFENVISVCDSGSASNIALELDNCSPIAGEALPSFDVVDFSLLEVDTSMFVGLNSSSVFGVDTSLVGLEPYSLPGIENYVSNSSFISSGGLPVSGAGTSLVGIEPFDLPGSENCISDSQFTPSLSGNLPVILDSSADPFSFGAVPLSFSSAGNSSSFDWSSGVELTLPSLPSNFGVINGSEVTYNQQQAISSTSNETSANHSRRIIAPLPRHFKKKQVQPSAAVTLAPPPLLPSSSPSSPLPLQNSNGDLADDPSFDDELNDLFDELDQESD